MEPGRLKPSDSAPVLQYGSGPSSDFLAKILPVDTLLFPCNSRFNFPLPSLLLHKSRKEEGPCVVRDSSDGSVFAYAAGGRGLIPNDVIVGE
jgi:hypothetical protein